MTFGRLLLRNLRYHWRGNLAVLLGVVVGTAVLTGALFVGDSLRGSLRDLAGEQLGWVEHALVGGKFLRAELADKMPAERVCPAILVQATAGTGAGDEARRVGQVMLLGVDDRFWTAGREPAGPAFWKADKAEGKSAEVVLNSVVARELGVNAGDTIRVNLQKVSRIPRETLLGRREAGDVVDDWPLTVRAVLADHAPGDRFNLNPSPTPPRNVFVPLRLLQARLGQEGRANALFARGGDTTALQKALRGKLTLGDWGLVLRDPENRTHDLFAKLDRNRDGELSRAEWRRRVAETFAEGVRPKRPGVLTREEVLAYYRAHRAYLSLESRNMLLEPAAVDAARAAAKGAGLRAAPTLVYLANGISHGGESIPYSVVAALDPTGVVPPGPLPTGADALGEDEILLAAWSAAPTPPEPGGDVTLTFFLPENQGGLREARSTFKLRGLVPLTGPTADPDLTPEFPGITDKLDIKQWDPPFPYDNKRVKKEDELYWEQYRTTPKAYITYRKGVELWGSRFGNATSIRLAPAEGADLARAAADFERRLLATLQPEQAGLVFEAVRQRSEEAGPGGLDFGGLFLGFSFFLIAAALLLVGLLFRLNLDRRAGEIGLLVATGYPRRAVRRLLLGEGCILSVLGAALGCAGAVGYAWLLLEFLRAWWPGGLEASFLRLHVSVTSIIMGFGLAVLVSLLTIAWAVRILGKIAPSTLLAGQTTQESALDERPGDPGWARAVAAFCLILGLGLIIAGNWVQGHEAQAGTFFGGGALLLGAGLAAVTAWMRGERWKTVQGRGPAALAQLGRRNAARHRTRSLLTAGLLAAAAFLVVAVESFRRDPGRDFLDPLGGSGGYDLYAESALPIFQNLNTEEGRAELNFPRRAEVEFHDAVIEALRLRAGDDASCLNLANPRRPRLFGVPVTMIREGGFRFAALEGTTPQAYATPWQLLQMGPAGRTGGAIPVFGEKNTVAWMLKSGLGGEVIVPDERGRPVKLRIVGLLQDSVFQSGLLMSEENFLKLYPSHAGYNVFLVRAPAERPTAVKTLLERTLAPQGFEVTRSAERLAMYLAVENTYLSTFQMLGGLGLLLGALGLAVVLLRGVWERRGELALLRALGFRSGALGWLVLAENGFLLALGLGVGTLSALLAVLPHVAGGGQVPWLRLAGLLALVLVVGLAAGAAAVAASLRAPLVPALRRE